MGTKNNCLKSDYENIVHRYCLEFASKHGYSYYPDDWVAGQIGGVVDICEKFINFDDIRYDIDNNIDENEFIKWYNYTIDIHDLSAKSVNYDSWCKGFRPYTTEQIIEMKKKRNQILELQAELNKIINESKCNF